MLVVCLSRVVGPGLGAGQFLPWPLVAAGSAYGWSGQGARSARDSDAVGALEASAREQRIGQQRARGVRSGWDGWWWTGWVDTTRRSRAGRCAACLMFAC